MSAVKRLIQGGMDGVVAESIVLTPFCDYCEGKKKQKRCGLDYHECNKCYADWLKADYDERTLTDDIAGYFEE